MHINHAFSVSLALLNNSLLVLAPSPLSNPFKYIRHDPREHWIRIVLFLFFFLLRLYVIIYNFINANASWICDARSKRWEHHFLFHTTWLWRTKALFKTGWLLLRAHKRGIKKKRKRKRGEGRNREKENKREKEKKEKTENLYILILMRAVQNCSYY